jgi:putative ABC transport system substrate-binding protein
MRRREFIALIGGAAACPARGQQARSQRQIAIVAPARSVEELRDNPYHRSFIEELAKRGLVEGRNLIVDRSPGGGQMNAYLDIAQTAVSKHPEAILTAAPEMTLALTAVTRTIPIITLIGDPVATGVAASLARPGRNVTGITMDGGMELHGKRLSLLIEARRGASRVAYLCSSAAWNRPQAAAVRNASQSLNLSLLHVDLGMSLDEAAYAAAYTSISASAPDVLLVSDEPEHMSNRKALIDLAAKARVPAMYPFRDIALSGGFMAYYRDLHDAFRQAADQVTQVLQGVNPAEMPFRQPTNFKLSINTKTAQQIGVTVPPTLLASADEVIE